MPLSRNLGYPTCLVEWMRLNEGKFHFLKIETIVVDRTALSQDLSLADIDGCIESIGRKPSPGESGMMVMWPNEAS